jgi:large subunit ribosomal protein L4
MAAQAALFTPGGDKLGKLDLPETVFGIEPNGHAVWEAVVNYQANQRLGTAKTKTRGEIARSNSKPWRQKGTGRARAGSWRSPLWVGGGRMHGPVPRDHSYRLPKKVRRLALRSALSDRAAAERVLVIEDFRLTEAKTKELWQLLRKMELADAKVLILVDELDEKLALSARNLPNVVTMPSREANTYTVVAADWVLITKGGLARIAEVLG